MKLYALVLVVLSLSSSAFAADFTCNGRANDGSGALADAKITLHIEGDTLSVTENDSGAFGFEMQATLDENYRPSAKYAGYYRFNATSQNDAGWDAILIEKFMLDNKRAVSGAAVIQGTEEDGGMASYFDTCHKVD